MTRSWHNESSIRQPDPNAKYLSHHRLYWQITIGHYSRPGAWSTTGSRFSANCPLVFRPRGSRTEAVVNTHAPFRLPETIAGLSCACSVNTGGVCRWGHCGVWHSVHVCDAYTECLWLQHLGRLQLGFWMHRVHFINA